jgi:hypothetical protein
MQYLKRQALKYKLQQPEFLLLSHTTLHSIYTHTHTHKITVIKINFDHLHVKLPHNAQQETKHRDTSGRGFSIIYY